MDHSCQWCQVARGGPAPVQLAHLVLDAMVLAIQGLAVLVQEGATCGISAPGFHPATPTVALQLSTATLPGVRLGYHVVFVFPVPHAPTICYISDCTSLVASRSVAKYTGTVSGPDRRKKIILVQTQSNRCRPLSM